eukprot:CAMPEP_0182536306 /NCGR_PEP_ID=MMETSP1323-20130603/19760_1 /TAXON_ID=236787 /ORGANISM="Florenciella parvula, Strain RCC1693" /LENGTH=59 /DNA_ID=CAMNT_0024746525 /DNA_START=84 /DNA_END=260 /DNA_ORIENTATION=-
MAQAFELRSGTIAEIALHRSLGVAYCAAGWSFSAWSSSDCSSCDQSSLDEDAMAMGAPL